MTGLAKVLFIACHNKKSPSNAHGLLKADKWSGKFEELTVEIKKDGTFPQFHGCLSKENLTGLSFSIKDLFSVIPEVKVEFETVFGEKSRTLKTEKAEHGVKVIDTELDKYTDLEKKIFLIPGFSELFLAPQQFKNKWFFWSKTGDSKNVFTRTLSGELYLTLPIETKGHFIVLPEMSAHFLIMFLLGMLSRYQPEEWGKTIKGEESNEIYLIRKFLDVTIRKFPNLVLNQLHSREFLFLGTVADTKIRLTNKHMDEIAEHTSRYIAEQVRRRR